MGDGLPSLHAAVKFYRARFKQTVAKPVADVVVELLKVKQARGVSDRYRADLDSRLTMACHCAGSTIRASARSATNSMACSASNR